MSQAENEGTRPRSSSKTDMHIRHSHQRIQYEEEHASFERICDKCEILEQDIRQGENALKMAILRLQAQCHRWVALILIQRSPYRTDCIQRDEIDSWIAETHPYLSTNKGRYKQLWSKINSSKGHFEDKKREAPKP